MTREPRPLVQYRDEEAARDLSADDYEPAFERHEVIAMVAIVLIFVGTFLAIYLQTGRI